MMTSGMHSQTLSKSNENGRFITAVERDSAFVKIQRGKMNAERVQHLQGALAACDSVKMIYVDIVSIQEIQKDSLYLIINKQDTIIENLELNNTDQKKKNRRASFWWFIKGVGTGVVLAAALVII